MKNSMIKHFLSLRKNGGKLTKKTLNENEVVLCDGFFFFIQDRNKMVLNENIFVELNKDIFTEMIEKREYEECKIACYLPTWRKNKYNILLKNNSERVVISKEKLDLFEYEKVEIRNKTDLVKVYDKKGKLLGGILPIRCADEAYEI